MRAGGVSGIGLTTAVVGLMAVWFGINDVPPLQGLAMLLRGQMPTPRAPKVAPAVAPSSDATGGGATIRPASAGTATGGGGGALGQRIAVAARKYLGKPYVWGAAGPNTFDCSGLVTWILQRDIGMPIKRMYTQQFLVWGGARTVGWDDQAPGDLACWSGHIGVCIGGGRMIHAPRPGLRVMEDKIWRVPAPSIRRVKPTGGT